MLERNAWRSLTGKSRRFLDVLMIEHMRHGGKANGKLLAPRRQLEALGMSAHSISGAINEAVALGFVDVKRGTGRRASTYALTWLQLHDGTKATNRWQTPVGSADVQSLERTADVQ